MTILTGGMIKQKGWPKFSPSDITVPKGATVVLTITSYDDGTAPLPSGMTYNNVTGGTETVNGQAVTTVANANLAHTFTVPSLGLNAPIPAAPTAAAGGPRQTTTVVFTFKATKSGTFTWQCMAPCGSGANGMGGAMVTNGYMKGTLTVA
jgi:heme/copper-type cytochrome/quinol oxidase subunit 2